MRFPVESLRIQDAKFTRNQRGLSVEVGLQAFEYQSDSVVQTESTTILLPDIDLEDLNADRLSGTTRKFATNPSDGYVDGSIYIHHAHHPVDLFEIRFGQVIDDKLEALFSVNLVLSFEGLGQYEDTVWSFQLPIPIANLQTADQRT